MRRLGWFDKVYHGLGLGNEHLDFQIVENPLDQVVARDDFL